MSSVASCLRPGAITLAALVVLGGCKPENKFVAPPPAEISVAAPLQQRFAPYIELTGNTVSFATVDLVARVEGFLTKINYKDGALSKKGDLLFEIEQINYIAKVKQAEAELESAKAQLLQAQAEFTRQETLLRQNVTAQNTYDQAKAKRDSAAANVDNQSANLTIAQTNLEYTRVMAPFDGVVTKHQVSVGELVGNGTATTLASIVQLDPIYVTFNMSEQDTLNIRHNLGTRKVSIADKVPLEIGLMNEQGYPHKGTLDYVAPTFDTSTGTLLLRGVFDNPDRTLLPGLFVRVKVPLGLGEKDWLVVPNRVVSEDQAGPYLLVVNKDDVVEQRRVKPGQMLVGGLRAIESGITKDDRVVVSTNGRAIPGAKVTPRQTTIQPAASQ